MGFSKIEARNSENNVQHDLFCLFDLKDIFPGYKLLVNISYLIVSLLPVDQSRYVIAQRLLDSS